jgi:uncharacterized CHY-type Zn-finger protein
MYRIYYSCFEIIEVLSDVTKRCVAQKREEKDEIITGRCRVFAV